MLDLRCEGAQPDGDGDPGERDRAHAGRPAPQPAERPDRGWDGNLARRPPASASATLIDGTQADPGYRSSTTEAGQPPVATKSH